MAKTEKYYVGPIIKELTELVTGVLEPQYGRDGAELNPVFSGCRPSTVENMSEFIVVSASRSVYSHGPYQNAAIYFDFFVRNGQGGIEMTYRLQEICDAITDLLPHFNVDEESGEKRWSVTRPKLVLQGNDSLGFTAWRLRARLFVNTTDRYATISDI